MTEFQKVLIALVSIRNSTERAILSFYSFQGSNLASKPDRENDPYLKFTLQNYLLILLCSFLDEWNALSSHAKDNEAVREAQKIVKPALDRFKKWPHLHKIRSGMLAHSPNNHGELILPWEAFAKYRCPTTLEEILLLAFCALMAVDYIKARFQGELSDAEASILEMDRTINIQGIPNTKSLEKTFSEIQDEITKNKAAST